MKFITLLAVSNAISFLVTAALSMFFFRSVMIGTAPPYRSSSTTITSTSSTTSSTTDPSIDTIDTFNNPHSSLQHMHMHIHTHTHAHAHTYAHIRNLRQQQQQSQNDEQPSNEQQQQRQRQQLEEKTCCVCQQQPSDDILGEEDEKQGQLVVPSSSPSNMLPSPLTSSSSLFPSGSISTSASPSEIVVDLPLPSSSQSPSPSVPVSSTHPVSALPSSSRVVSPSPIDPSSFGIPASTSPLEIIADPPPPFSSPSLSSLPSSSPSSTIMPPSSPTSAGSPSSSIPSTSPSSSAPPSSLPSSSGAPSSLSSQEDEEEGDQWIVPPPPLLLLLPEESPTAFTIVLDSGAAMTPATPATSSPNGLYSFRMGNSSSSSSSSSSHHEDGSVDLFLLVYHNTTSQQEEEETALGDDVVIWRVAAAGGGGGGSNTTTSDNDDSTNQTTKKSTTTTCYMQSDGNMVVRSANHIAVLWTSQTGQNPGAYLILDDDGQLSIVVADTPITATTTSNNGTARMTHLWLTGRPKGEVQSFITSTLPPSTSSATNLSFPIRGAFYYPWFPETWTVNNHSTHHNAKLGKYQSGHMKALQSHIDALSYAHVDLAIASWFGSDTHLDRARLTNLLTMSALTTATKWTIYHEAELGWDPSVADIRADLAYLKKWFVWHESWAHIDGRPVIFVYNEPRNCGVSERWMEAAAADNWYVVLKLFRQFTRCPVQPDSWHQYGPAEAVIHNRGHSISISPGFWRADRDDARLDRLSADAWRENVNRMVDSRAPWQLITTFNEWGEGTAVESGVEWESESGYGYYLDALHEIR